MAKGRTIRRLVDAYGADEARRDPDQLAVEEPLEIRIDDTAITTTMRTPGHDFELAAGFCHTDGFLAGAPVRRIRYCATGSAVGTGFNVVTVETGGVAAVPTARLTTTTSSCGVCGAADVDALVDRLDPLHEAARPPLEVLAGVAEAVKPHQEVFAATGGVHAAAAFNANGAPTVTREDIGRHNAIDKVVGHLLLAGELPAAGLGLFVSGRASFEVVQKAWAAGFGTIVAVSAPSSLAVTTAERAGITLAGFVRDGRWNLYTSPSGAPTAHPAGSGDDQGG